MATVKDLRIDDQGSRSEDYFLGSQSSQSSDVSMRDISVRGFFATRD